MRLKKCMLVGILVAGAVAHLSFTSVRSEHSDIRLATIEALSSGEADERCYGVGSVDCPCSSDKVQVVIYF